ncbi:MAG TPA: tyrosine-type recombinase/integrase [Thermoanaerobaculia bacterium]|nr:tyrosine-type recombinase/integrase [Thermoanaerobaculia bacterium]
MRIPGFEYDSKRRRVRFDVYVPGKKGRARRRRTVEHVTRDEALAAWREFRASCVEGTPRGPLTFRQFNESYYDLIAAALRPSTVKTQRHIMKNHLIRFFGETLLEEITTIRVLDFKTDMRNRGLSAAYINDAVRLLKTLLNQAVERDVIAHFPIRKRIPKEAERKPELELEAAERAAFLRAFDNAAAFHKLLAERRKLGPVRTGKGFKNARRFGGGMRPRSDAAKLYFARFRELRDFFIVALETGLRVWSDLRNLRWADVDLAGGTIRVATRKTGNEAVIALSGECRRALFRFRREHVTDLVFVDQGGKRFSESRIRRSFLLAKTLAGITRRFRPHDLRHTFGCRLASRGVSLQLIARSLGHTSTTMAERYARPSKEAMHAVAKALDGDSLSSAHTAHSARIVSNHSSYRAARRRTVVLARMVRAKQERTRYATTLSNPHHRLSFEHM